MIALAWVSAVAVALVGLLWVFQRSLIYLPSATIPPPPPFVEEVDLSTEDGLSLSAWHLSVPESRATVIVFNGNAGNRAHRLPLGEALAGAGFSVVLTDYRGYGANPGAASEEGLALDARAALAFVREKARDHPVVYFGESLGAGVAISLAVEEHPAALVLRSPFASLPDVAAVHYRWLPTRLMLRDRYPNLERIGDVDAPVLVIAGGEDRIVPVEQSRRVYEGAAEPKDLLVVDGADHNDRALLDGDEMMQTVIAFIERALSGTNP